MKKGFMVIVVLIIVSVSGSVLAQNANLDRLNAYKIAFFTRRLNLTPREAEKFWPVYNEFQNNRNKIQQERGQLNRNFNQEASLMSDEQLSAAGDKLIELEVRETELAVTFHKQLKGILPPVKILRLYQAENQYRMQLLKELQERRPVRDEQ
ncbi:MAG: hypothetical protein IQL11_02950 [Bacteroidales bacterium]|nr:hypothetical protein [Bacteroidales bacterium]